MKDTGESVLFDPTLPRGWFGWRGDTGSVRVAARTSATGPVMATVVAELQFSGEARGETTMLRADDGVDRAFTLRVTSNGTLRVDRRAGDAVSSLSLPGAITGPAGSVIVSYSVDTLRGRSLLTAESLSDTGSGLIQHDGFDPISFDPAEMAALLTPARRIRPGASAVWAGIALGQLPMAVRPGLHGSTPILTPDGPRRIDQIGPGDTVVTSEGRNATVRWTGTLRMPAAGSFRPVRLRAPFYGRTTDLIVAPYQRILLTGPEVEYLLGEEQVLVEARHMVDGRTALPEGGEGIVSYHGLLLDHHLGLDADGCATESLFIGDLASNPGLMRATVLRDADPADLPQNQTRLCRDLQGYETATLSALRDMRHRQAVS